MFVFLRVLVLLLLLALSAAAWLWQDLQRFAGAPLSLPAGGLLYQVQTGASLRGIAADLQRRGVLSRPHYLRAVGRLQGLAHRIKAGEYRLEAGLSPLALLQKLAAGDVVVHGVTLVEGLTFRDTLKMLQAHPVLEQTLEPADLAGFMASIGLPDESPEGRFLAETYHFNRGASEADILRRAHRTLKAYLAAQWAARAPNLPLETPYQALILASIVEKETGLAAERPRIAGVFMRRLRRGMRLQTDPTVIYGLGEAFDGNLRKSHLQADNNPYNTYRIAALPPTPICLPGRDAIRATLHPKEDDDSLYFVARGDGSHQFSSSLKAHNRAVRKYQLGK